VVLRRLVPAPDLRRGRPAAAARTAAAAAVGDKIVLRPARPADAEAVAPLLDELGYPASPDQALDRLQRLTADPAAFVLVAEVGDEVAGFAGLYVLPLVESDEPGCVFSALVVGERFRRLGVGARLADAIEAEARARGGKKLVLSSAHRRADAHAFYEARGYEHTGRRYAKVLG
jgi:ribosomal protein S18 acetylase RimI-like enzyme